ncbi:unnamed protein product [Calicophoron daubneyi]|uniref:Uncharacterized protein n=1 Tax=Calicophoron daubneyi TaxID=300641 RepID=A0AAV2TWM7_CALDB
MPVSLHEVDEHQHLLSCITLHQLTRLRGMQNLTVLSFEGNPAVDMLVFSPSNSSSSDSGTKKPINTVDARATYRSFALFHLRTLLVLDGQEVTAEEYQIADRRFSQVELSHLAKKVEKDEEKLAELEQTNSVLQAELLEQKKISAKNCESQKREASQVEQLQKELLAKNQLLRSKSEEVARAYLKHHELEQELAFHKIDSKLAAARLGSPPQLMPDDVCEINDTADQPYLGRCRYRFLPVGTPNNAQGKSFDCSVDGSSEPRLSDQFRRNSASNVTDSSHCPLVWDQLSSNHTNGRVGGPSEERVELKPKLPTKRTISGTFQRTSSNVESSPHPIGPSISDRPQSAPTASKHTIPLPPNTDHISPASPCSALSRESNLNGMDERNRKASQAIRSLVELEQLANLISDDSAIGLSCKPTRDQIEEAIAGLRARLVSEDSVLKCNATNSPNFPIDPDFNTQITSLGLDLKSAWKLGQQDTFEATNTKEKINNLSTTHLPSNQAQMMVTVNSCSVPVPSGMTFAAHRLPASPQLARSRKKGHEQSMSTSDQTKHVKPSAIPNEPTEARFEADTDWCNRASQDTDGYELGVVGQPSQACTAVDYGPAPSTPSSRTAGTGRSMARCPMTECDCATLQTGRVGLQSREECLSRMMPPIGSRHQLHPNAVHHQDRSPSFGGEESEEDRSSAVHLDIRPKDNMNVRNSVFRTSRHGLQRRARRAMNSAYSGSGCSGSHRRRRRLSTESLGDHAQELLDMIILSRKACTSEVSRIRADLARLQRRFAELQLPAVPVTAFASKSMQTPPHGDGGINHNSSRATGGPRDTQSGRGTVRSFGGDTLTTVTRPSPPGNVDYFDFTEDCNSKTPIHSSVDNQRRHEQTARRTRRLLPTASYPEDDFVFIQDDLRNSCGTRDPTPRRERWSPEAYQPNEGCSPIRNHVRRVSLPEAANEMYETHRFVHGSTYPRPRDCALLEDRHSWHMNNNSSSPPAGFHRNPRGRSLDYVRRERDNNLGSRRFPSRARLDRADEDDPSTETAALLNLTQELMGLRQGLKRTREENSGRLEIALKHISLLEHELQRQKCLAHDAENARARDAERSRWERRLAATLSELKQCQANISELRKQMDEIESAKGTGAQSEDKQQQKEIDQTKATLDQQKEEISRLNRLLNRLLGIDPSDASPSDLEQIQTSLVDLNRRMQSRPAGTVLDQGPVRRTQSMQAGLAPPVSARNQSGYLTPTQNLINATSSGNLFCSVPEHHYLEDCMEQLQRRVDEAQEVQKQLKQANKTNRRQEKLLKDQAAEIERLNTDLNSRLEEARRVTDCKRDAEKESQDRLVNMAADLASIEGCLVQRRDELAKLETNLSDGNAELTLIQAQVKEALKQYDATKQKQSVLNSELNTMRTDTEKAKHDLVRANEELVRAQAQVDDLNATKAKLKSSRKDLEENIRNREAEFKQLVAESTQLEIKLTHTQAEVTAGEERIKVQQATLIEKETAVSERREDLKRLSQKIEEDRKQLDSLAREIGEKRTELELVRADKEREQDAAAANARDLAAQNVTRQRELYETQTSLNTLKEEKTQLTEMLEALRAEHQKLGSEIQTRHKNSELGSIHTEVEREQNELERLIAERKGVETELKQLIQERNLAQNQLDTLQKRIKEHEGRESYLLESVASSKMELAKMQMEIEGVSDALKHKHAEQRSAQAEYDHLRKRLDASRSELKRADKQLSSVKSTVESQEQSLAEQKRQHMKLTDELGKLREGVHAGRLAKQAANEERDASELSLQNTLTKLDKAKQDQRQIEKRLISTGRQLDNMESELTDKQSQLKALEDRIQSAEARLEQLGYTEARFIQLEKEVELIQTGNKSDRSSKRGEHRAHSGTDNDLLRTLEETKAALNASRRDHKRFKRRTARELNELQHIAEEQCNRAGELTEQLALVKRQYSQLKGQIATYGVLMDEVMTVASQSKLTKQGKRLEMALNAVRNELEQNHLGGSLPDEQLLLTPLDSNTNPTTRNENSEQSTIGHENHFNQDNDSNSNLHPPVISMTGSFHAVCDPGLQTLKPCMSCNDLHSPHNSVPGLYKSFTTESQHGSRFDLCENTVGTGTCCRTGVTSGLGSSLNPGTQLESSGSAPDYSTTSAAPHTPSSSDPRADWQTKMAERVLQQQRRAAADWDESDCRFRQLRRQMEQIRGNLG